MKKLTKKDKLQIDDFVNRLVQMKHEASCLGLYKTMHATSAVKKRPAGPVYNKNKGPLAQLVRAPLLHRGGCRFEPYRDHHLTEETV